MLPFLPFSFSSFSSFLNNFWPYPFAHHFFCNNNRLTRTMFTGEKKKGYVGVGMDIQFDKTLICMNGTATSGLAISIPRYDSRQRENPPRVSFRESFNAMAGSRSWIGGFFNRLGNKRNVKFLDYPLTPIQEQRLQKLQERIHIPFDETRPDHQEALRELWHIAFPNVALQGPVTEQWKEMGWQGPNPSTDFRACGFISLENLLFYGRTYPASFHRLLLKQDGIRATWEYPFAVAGINISFMLIQMLDLYSEKPTNLPGYNFLKLLGEDDEAFDVLYCIAFVMVDMQWLSTHASYMEFNKVLQATGSQLERELCADNVHRIQDLPAYNLLYR